MRFALCPTLMVVALVSGCGTNPPTPVAGDTPIDVKPVTVAELDGFITSQKGKVVLIDCWSTT